MLRLNVLQCRLFTNTDEREADTSLCGNRFRFTRVPLPFHACAASVSRVRRFRFTRVPLPFHACAASGLCMQTGHSILHPIFFCNRVWGDAINRFWGGLWGRKKWPVRKESFPLYVQPHDVVVHVISVSDGEITFAQFPHAHVLIEVDGFVVAVYV